MKHYDGMEGFVEQSGKNYLYISNCKPSWKNIIRYEQLGIYRGNTDGIEETDIVKIYFKKARTLKQKLGELFAPMTLNYANIERVEFIKAGQRPKGISAKIKYWVLT